MLTQNLASRQAAQRKKGELTVKLNALTALVAFSGLLMAESVSTVNANANVPAPAKSVELQRYLGRWYELARYENRFEKDCEAVTATYTQRDGHIEVVNACRKGDVDGPYKAYKGKAKVVDGSAGAKLKVSFFPPFYGNYWILDRDDKYTWSIVGEPKGKYLWILTRDPTPSPAKVEELIERAAALGYDRSRLRLTKHAPS